MMGLDFWLWGYYLDPLHYTIEVTSVYEGWWGGGEGEGGSICIVTTHACTCLRPVQTPHT